MRSRFLSIVQHQTFMPQPSPHWVVATVLDQGKPQSITSTSDILITHPACLSTLRKLWLAPGQDELSGNWILHATLVAEPVHVSALPSPVRTSNGVYTFTSIRVTSTAVHIEWTAAGALIDDPRLANHESQASDQLTTDYLLPRLFDSAGHETQDSTSGIEFSRPVKIQFDGYVSGPGRYRLQLGDALTGAAYEVWIVVP